jgi:hypothetical protein
MKSSYLKRLIVLLLVAAHQVVTARLPFGVPTLAPLRKRFNKKRSSSTAVCAGPESVVRKDDDKVKSKFVSSIHGPEISSLLPLRLLHQVSRFAVLVVGSSLAWIVFFPNLMFLSDSSEGGLSLKAILASQLGVAACLLLFLGGCAGYASQESSIFECWKALIPGLICQALMLLLIR